MNRDKLVAIRNGMVMALQKAIKEGNEGNTSLYNKTVSKIKEMDGYDVVREQDNVVNGVEYRAVVSIMENGNQIMAVCLSKDDKLTSLEVKIEDLLTDAELEARRNMTPDDIIDGLLGKRAEPI
ncbi:hypothetical protein [Bacillus phage vB_BanS-Thrax1]|nr:hypothetical protein [Bacillus phage vB_BanS-Thrax1]